MNKIQTILFWIDGVFDKEFQENELYKDLNLNRLNSIVNDGCVGQLLYSQPSSSDNDKNKQGEFNELLGFKHNEKLTEQLFKEKYMNLKVKLISNVDDELSIFSNSVKLIINQEEENNCIKSLVDNIKNNSNNEEMIIIHYQINDGALLKERRNALLNLELFMSTLLFENSNNKETTLIDNYYINIIIGYNKTNIEIPKTVQQQQQLNNKPINFNLPTQSYSIINSESINPRLTSPLFTIHYNSIFTRKDNTKSFCESEFINGSNDKILLLQHFRELAFKLGKVPKYGA